MENVMPTLSPEHAKDPSEISEMSRNFGNVSERNGSGNALYS